MSPAEPARSRVSRVSCAGRLATTHAIREIHRSSGTRRSSSRKTLLTRGSLLSPDLYVTPFVTSKHVSSSTSTVPTFRPYLSGSITISFPTPLGQLMLPLGKGGSEFKAPSGALSAAECTGGAIGREPIHPTGRTCSHHPQWAGRTAAAGLAATADDAPAVVGECGSRTLSGGDSRSSSRTSADPRSSRRSLSAEGATLAGPLLWIRGRLGASRRRFVGNCILVPGRVLVDVVPAARER
jgi:hypothetical protein